MSLSEQECNAKKSNLENNITSAASNKHMKPVNPNQSPWIILPGGFSAIHRSPLLEIPEGCRQATFAEFSSANFGAAFPWGFTAEPKLQGGGDGKSKMWHEYRIGYGGLVHSHWFVCQEGRAGGAPNVIETLPGALRHGLYLDGGQSAFGLGENEGYAVVRSTTEEDRKMYRKVQLHAMERVAADAGNIIVSPVEVGGPGESNASVPRVYVGMTGRCMWCPNREGITLRQIRESAPDYEFILWDEYKSS